MSIIPYVTAQLHIHPSMTPQDVGKLCYQAAHGAEHLLADPDRARSYLERELEATPADGRIPLVEPISDTVARVNLAAWRFRGLSADRLFDLFVATAQVSGGGEDRLLAYLTEVGEWIEKSGCPIPPAEWQDFLRRYGEAGYPAVHHSEAYRKAERPAYRIVRRDLLAELA